VNTPLRSESSLVSIVIPVYNEEAVINEFHDRLVSAINDAGLSNVQILYVNDGSKDHTSNLLQIIAAKDERVDVVILVRNFGHQSAMWAGIMNSKGDCIISIDADLQDPPEVIKLLIELWKNGDEIVVAQRSARDSDSFFKRTSAKLFYLLISKMSDHPVDDNVGDFRLISRNVADSLAEIPSSSRYLRGSISWMGYRKGIVEYERAERYAGKSKYSLRKMIRLALAGIVSTSARPLLYIFRFALFVSTIAIGYSAFIVLSKFLDPSSTIPGYASLMIIVLTVGAIQLFSIAVLGIYIAEILENTQQRPIYIQEPPK
jgi:polyisoprenyl-phosphate glycosyltransferase